MKMNSVVTTLPASSAMSMRKTLYVEDPQLTQVGEQGVGFALDGHQGGVVQGVQDLLGHILVGEEVYELLAHSLLSQLALEAGQVLFQIASQGLLPFLSGPPAPLPVPGAPLAGPQPRGRRRGP